MMLLDVWRGGHSDSYGGSKDRTKLREKATLKFIDILKILRFDDVALASKLSYADLGGKLNV